MATAIDPGFNMYEYCRNMGAINTDPRVGDEVIAPGLSADLEAFYDKTDSPADQAKCLELLTSLRLGEELRNQQNPNYVPEERPHTAMPAFSRDPYQTTYNRDYPQKESEVSAQRPMTSQGFVAPHDLGGPIGVTTYNKEFHDKLQNPSSPIRSGSASGARNNRPHPPQSFMIWRYPGKARLEQEGSPWSEAVTDDMMKQVHKRLCQSTYQSDYLGIPQGFQVKSAYNLPPDWKANIPYTLDSVARYSYQEPVQQEELKLPASRYGSNKKKQLAASGTIPTASARYLHIKQRTTYDRHYNDNSSAVVSQIRDVGRKLGAEALKKYHEKAAGEDKDLIAKMLEAYSPGAVAALPPRPPPARMSLKRPSSRVPPSTPISNTSEYVPLLEHHIPNRTKTPTTASSGRDPPSSVRSPNIRLIRPPSTPMSLPMKGARTPATPISVPYTPPMFLA